MSRFFNGSSDFISPSSNVNPSTSIVIIAWFKVASIISSGGNDHCIYSGSFNLDAIVKSKFYFSLTPINALRGIAGNGTLSGYAESVSIGNRISTNKWQWAAYTYDNSGDKKVHLYLNGIEVSYTTNTQHDAAGWSTNNGERLGRSISSAPSYFNGGIANFQLFSNTILSLGEIKYAALNPGRIRRGLSIYWPLIGYSPSEKDYSNLIVRGVLTGTRTSSDEEAVDSLFTPLVSVDRQTLKIKKRWHRRFVSAALPAVNLTTTKLSILTNSKLSILARTKVSLKRAD